MLKQNFDIPLQFLPKAPDRQMSMAASFTYSGGTTTIGQYNIVVLNRGAKHGLDAGHVLTVWQAGQTIKDRFQRAATKRNKVQVTG